VEEEEELSVAVLDPRSDQIFLLLCVAMHARISKHRLSFLATTFGIPSNLLDRTNGILNFVTKTQIFSRHSHYPAEHLGMALDIGTLAEARAGSGSEVLQIELPSEGIKTSRHLPVSLILIPVSKSSPND
jgi:hypothetical protein